MSIKITKSGKLIYPGLIIIILLVLFMPTIYSNSDIIPLFPSNNTNEVSKTNSFINTDSGHYKENTVITNINSSLNPVFSSYFGGEEKDSINSVAVDNINNLIAITGVTQSEDLPLTEENQKERPGNIDGFLALLNSKSKALLYSEFIGGKGSDKPVSVVFDNKGNLYIAGYTDSEDLFTTKDALQKKNNGKWDIFILKINSSDFNTEYSTYIGGSSSDVLHDIAVDSYGNLYLTGTTESKDFITTKGAFQENITGKRDAFLMKFNPEENCIVYSTLFGGVSDDYSEAIGIDSEFNAYITGYTYSSKTRSLPVRNNIFGPSTFSYDSYIAAFNPDGSDLIYSTYIGGGGGDRAKGIVVSEEKIHITGYTYSRDFPVKNAYQNNSTDQGDSEGFLTCIKKDGSEVIYSTYLGGEGDDFIHTIQTDEKGNIILAGETKSGIFLNSGRWENNDSNPDEKKLNNNCNAFIAVFPEDANYLNSVILIQGNEYDVINNIYESDGKIVAAGMTKSNDLTATKAIQMSNAGSYDGFISEFRFKE